MTESVAAYRASQQQALDDPKHHGHDGDGKPAMGCALASGSGRLARKSCAGPFRAGQLPKAML